MDNTKDALSEFNNVNYVDDRRSTACYEQEITELKQQKNDLLTGCQNARTAFAEGKTIVELMVIIDEAIAKAT